MSFLTPICPTGCDTNLPPVDFNYCDPAVEFEEITRIFVANYDAAALADVEDLAEWNTRLDNVNDGADLIRYFDVMADLPVPDRSPIDISRKRKVWPPAKFTINVDIDDVSDLNYEFMRTSQCNQRYRFWYVAGTKIFGGNDGFTADMILDYKIDRGTQSIHLITGQITWENQFSNERHDSPFV